jgi:DNA-binding NtrC family response regulator
MHLLTLTNDASLRDQLRSTLGEASCAFHPAGTQPDALGQDLAREPDALLLDLAGDGKATAEFVARMRKQYEKVPLLILCADEHRDPGLSAIKQGAADYLCRPLAMDELAAKLRRVQEVGHLRKEVSGLRNALERQTARAILVAESEPMVRLREALTVLAGESQPILLIGERGSGKKTLAEFVHRMHGQRKSSTVVIPVRDLGTPLLESSLWREAREAGTVALEHVESLSEAQQQALARMLGGPSRDSAPRVIALSEARLDQPSERKSFSSELFACFGPAVFVIPPLRERAADVPALLAHFAQRTAQRLGRPVSISPRALAMLAVYPWPGNVHEVETALERAAQLGGNGRLEYADFGLVPGVSGPGDNGRGALELKPQVEAFERQVLLQALSAAKGNRQAAARLLGISLRTLFYKIKRYDVD